MKKLLTTLLLIPLLTSCDFLVNNFLKNQTNNEEINNNEDIKDEEQQEDVEKEEHNEDDPPYVVPPIINKEYQYGLDEWTTFSFSDNREPMYADNWNYYYGTSHNPNGCLYECPNEKIDGSGVIFEKKTQYIISPTFKNWTKIETYFDFYFSAKTSSSYQSVANQPQMILTYYDETNSVIGTEDVILTKNNVPNNGTYPYHFYIRCETISYFKLQYNNSIANGSAAYTPVLHSVRMKGWNFK